MRAVAFLLAAALMTLFVAAAVPTAAADPTCSGYRQVGDSKTRVCTDPEGASCLAWAEGWHRHLGYWYTCLAPTTAPGLPPGGCWGDLCWG